jgi:hypothetical protein
MGTHKPIPQKAGTIIRIEIYLILIMFILPMYFAVVALFLFVAPVISIVIESIGFPSNTAIVPLAGKWFVFWAAGIRLLTAGISQVFRPEFTAKEILGISDESSFHIVQELGFANLSIGIMATCSIVMHNWTLPAALSGGLFYGFAGFRHIFKKEKNLKEKVATYSDLYIFAVLLAYFISAFI